MLPPPTPLREPGDVPRRTFDLVLAADARWGIGKGNALPWPKLRADLQHFQRLTSTAAPGKQNAVIMGRRTWESREVGCRVLPRRHNVVITRQPLGLSANGASPLIAGSLPEALRQLDALPDLERIFVIGGAEIYRLALADERCRAAYVTRVHHDFDCDTFVPDLEAFGDRDPTWPVTAHREHELEFHIERLLIRPPPRT